MRTFAFEDFRILFHSMKGDGILDMDRVSHRVCLYLTYEARIQSALDSFRNTWNAHKLRTTHYRAPVAMYELSREVLIRRGKWSGDSEDRGANIGGRRGVYVGELAWVANLMAEFDFSREDGHRGVAVYLDAVRVMEERAPERRRLARPGA